MAIHRVLIVSLFGPMIVVGCSQPETPVGRVGTKSGPGAANSSDGVATANPGGQPVIKEGPGSDQKSGGMPAVVENDPFHLKVMNRLKASGLSLNEQNPAAMALAKTLEQRPAGVTLLGGVQCYGDAATSLSRDKKMRERFERMDNDVGRMELLSTWPIDGCTQDVQYSSSAAVVALDEVTIENSASPYHSWDGSNGHTVPRWVEDTKAGKIIVATWYFLKPQKTRAYGGIDQRIVCRLHGDCLQ